VVANATGMGVLQRGMLMPTVPAGTLLRDAIQAFPTDMLLKGQGFVDVIVGAEPTAGVFVLGTTTDQLQKEYLHYYKVGEGPLYIFYTPYHLCHLEMPNTFARVGIFHDAVVSPIGKPYAEVLAVAKKDLKKGEAIDCIGGYTVYGQCENAATARSEHLLPLGLAEGGTVKRNVKKDSALTFADVDLPPGRLIDRLWKEQVSLFA